MRTSSLTLAALLWCSSIARIPAADWLGWRGPDGLGVSSEKALPTAWSATEGIAWRYAVPGKGASSPVVAGKRVYITYQAADTGLHLVALDRINGKVVWDVEVGRGKLRSHDLHNMATPTPVTDGRRIWALFGTGDLACVDTSGKVMWHRNLVREFGPYNTNHGMGPSPVLLDGRLFITCMHQGPSYLMAVEARTGKTLWKTDRNLKAREEGNDSYSTPIVVRHGRKTELVLSGAEHLDSYDPATGNRRWFVGGLDVPHAYGRTIAGPTAADGLVITVASGFQNRGYVTAVRAGGSGDVAATHKAWTAARYAPDCPCPVVHNGLLFYIRDDGMASCVDLKTGEPHWQERLFTENVKVSPVAADGKVYFTSGRGNTVVVKAANKLEVLSRNLLNDDTLATPAIAHGDLILRTFSTVYCIRRK